MLYIKNARVCTPFEILKNACLVIKDKKIKGIASVASLPRNDRGAEVIDAGGNIVCPGLIDVHLQGAGGADFLDGTPEAIEQISQTLAKFGTTSYLATTVFKSGKNKHIKNIVKGYGVRGTGYGAKLLGIHLEGPFINPEKKGMIRTDGIIKYSPVQLKRVLCETKGLLKMMTVAPEIKGGLDVIKKLKKENIIASFGHSDASFEETKKGIGAGIDHATHIFNAMRSIHHRDPGPLPAILTDDKISVQLISDGVHIHPAVVKLIVRLKEIKNIILITDSMSSMGLPDGKYVYDGWNYESKNGACRYKDGTLIGTALPLNKMVKRMVDISGVSLIEAIQTATINPAKVLGIDDRKGSVAAGKDADLVIMDEECNVEMTVVEGQVVYRKEKS